MKNLFLPAFFISILLFGCSGEKPNNQGGDTTSANSDTITQNLEVKAKELAHKFLITDGHIDLPYRLMNHMEDVSQRTESGEFDYVRAREGGLDAPFMSIYIPAKLQETGGAKAYADTLINLVRKMAQDHPEKFALANSPDEAIANFEKGIISLPMGMENGAPIEKDLSNIQYFHDRGIRYITLTHSKDNQICDSSYDTARTWNGLSPFGEEVVKAMNEVGIMIDVSHISDSTFYQVIKISKQPVIASHSSCRHFVPGFERNMSDDMIKKIGENGGVVQVNFGSTFVDKTAQESKEEIDAHMAAWLSEQQLDSKDPKAEEYGNAYWEENFKYSNVEKVADHIDHIVRIAGVDHVGFGSDFDGVGNTLPVGLKDVSDYPNLIQELLKRGYSEEDIEKICYKNVFRVWRAVGRNNHN